MSQIVERVLPELTRSREYSEEHKAFWGESPPQGVLLATASLRKALMVWLSMNELDTFKMRDLSSQERVQRRKKSLQKMPDWLAEFFNEETWTDFIAEIAEDGVAESPQKFQKIIEKYIQNGDGEIKKGTVVNLGEYQGVPIFVLPTEGETGSNDPLVQSQQKVDWVIRNYPELGSLKIRIIASDTVGKMNSSQDDRLGKPRNHPEWPKEDKSLERPFLLYWLLTQFIGIELNAFDTWIATESAIVTNFDANWLTYLANLEIPDIVDEHQNALLVAEGDGEGNYQYSQQLTSLTVTISAARIRNGEIFPFAESGAGGIFQTGIDFSQPILPQISDAQLKTMFERVPEELQPLFFMFHCMGVPVVEAVQLFLHPSSQTEAASTV